MSSFLFPEDLKTGTVEFVCSHAGGAALWMTMFGGQVKLREVLPARLQQLSLSAFRCSAQSNAVPK